MAVEVVRGHYAGGAEMIEKYEAGLNFEVVEGHLVVLGAVPEGRRSAQKLAAFAPGSWKFGRVTD